VESKLSRVSRDLYEVCRTCGSKALLPHTRCIVCGSSVHPPHLTPRSVDIGEVCAYATENGNEYVCVQCSDDIMDQTTA
jgi:DNA-directed RNA polymerase subunit RPC12/RpoP